MPKVRKNKLAKKHSPKTKGKHRASKTRPRNQKLSKGKNIVDTFQAWIDNQAKSRKHSSSEAISKPTKMPADSMSEWLARQEVVEKEVPPEVNFPLGSMDEWLQKQVSSRLSEERSQEAQRVVTVGSPSTADTTIVSTAVSESTPSAETTATVETQKPA